MTIDEMLAKAQTVAIFGHVRPDGDCVGSALGLYNYIFDNYKNIKANVFLENFPKSYNIIRGANKVLPAFDSNSTPVDLMFLLDTPTLDRIGANGIKCLESAKFSCNIDHHISNKKDLCTVNIVESNSSSASETLYFQLQSKNVSLDTANSLYLGIVHDTGAFKFSCTGKRTMTAIGDMLDKGIDFSRIINETYYTRTYAQTLIAGVAMERAKLALNGRMVYSYVESSELKKFNVTPADLGCVIDLLREVSNTEIAVFIYPVEQNLKISLRSNYIVDVNAIAKEFGGGGHVRAAGGETALSYENAIQKIIDLAKKQLEL